MGTAIVITSGKGGTGKTTSVGAIASCLAALGHKTLCVDGDIGLKNLDLTLGMSDASLIDFSDLIEGRMPPEKGISEHPKIENLFFLSAPSLITAAEVDTEKMAALVDRLKDEFDFVIIDSPAGIGQGFRLAASGADMALVVTTADASSIRNGQITVSELDELGLKNVRVLVNRVRGQYFKTMKRTVDDIIDTVGAKLIGVVMEDKKVPLAASSEVPLVLYETRGAAAQYLNIARRLLGESVPVFKR